MKFYELTPQNIPPNPVLFPTFRKTFEASGHSYVSNIESCDVVLMDLHTRIAPYYPWDLDYIESRGTPLATFDEWDRGGMSADVWPYPLTLQMREFFEAIETIPQKRVHFCRLFSKKWLIPPNMFPYEKPILYEEPMVTADELFNREYDVCFIANTAPQRESIAKALREDERLKCNISIGATKIPFNDWVNEHRKAKLFVSTSAGGFSNERQQALFSIAGLIQEETDQLLLHPHTHLNNCIKVNSKPTKEQLDVIYNVVSSKDWLYDIYERNNIFMKSFYTEEYIAGDILKKIIHHLA